jgi:murein DD-endopeptidase MepM/ murein hydrolase activator NlpD
MTRWSLVSLGFWLAVLAILTTAADYPSEICYQNCPPRQKSPAGIAQGNPAIGWSVVETGTETDPLAAFGRRPIDDPWIIPAGGDYLDPDRGGQHFGIDYTFPEKFLNNIPQPVYPIGPGIVTAVHTCPQCYVGDPQEWSRWGQRRTGTIDDRNNYGYGAVVIIEHPYNEFVSFYSLYAHLRDIRVSVGQRVDSDMPLALLGASGDVAAPHVHLELRYGLPGLFWGADFSHLEVLRRWLEQRHDTPVFLLYAEHHIPFTRALDRWVEEEYPLQIDN